MILQVVNCVSRIKQEKKIVEMSRTGLLTKNTLEHPGCARFTGAPLNAPRLISTDTGLFQ